MEGNICNISTLFRREITLNLISFVTMETVNIQIPQYQLSIKYIPQIFTT